MKVSLKYTFVFDPLESWRNREDLETDLARFFRSKGLGLEKVKHSSDETAFDERIIFVEKTEEVTPFSKPEKEKTVKQQFRKVKSLSRDGKGRYLDGGSKRKPRR